MFSIDLTYKVVVFDMKYPNPLFPNSVFSALLSKTAHKSRAAGKGSYKTDEHNENKKAPGRHKIAVGLMRACVCVCAPPNKCVYV